MRASCTTTGAPLCERAASGESGCPGPRDRGPARSDGGELLATVAHELRGPLGAVLYALQAVADRTDGDPATRRACAIVERQARRAARIIDDLNDVCAGSWNKLTLRTEVADAAEVARAAVQSADHLIAGCGHRVTVSAPPDPLLVVADPSRLEQVLANLLANAAKFTEPGGHIQLIAEAEPGSVVLRVRDNGRGIPPYLLPRVFDLFSQGNDSGAPRAGGLGLGLALVKSLVELHGGRVEALSDGPGHGSEFVVRLPACGDEG